MFSSICFFFFFLKEKEKKISDSLKVPYWIGPGESVKYFLSRIAFSKWDDANEVLSSQTIIYLSFVRTKHCLSYFVHGSVFFSPFFVLTILYQKLYCNQKKGNAKKKSREERAKLQERILFLLWTSNLSKLFLSQVYLYRGGGLLLAASWRHQPSETFPWLYPGYPPGYVPSALHTPCRPEGSRGPSPWESLAPCMENGYGKLAPLRIPSSKTACWTVPFPVIWVSGPHSPSVSDRSAVISGPPLRGIPGISWVVSPTSLRGNLSGFVTFMSDVLCGFLEPWDGKESGRPSPSLCSRRAASTPHNHRAGSSWCPCLTYLWL